MRMQMPPRALSFSSPERFVAGAQRCASSRFHGSRRECQTNFNSTHTQADSDRLCCSRGKRICCQAIANIPACLLVVALDNALLLSNKIWLVTHHCSSGNSNGFEPVRQLLLPPLPTLIAHLARRDSPRASFRAPPVEAPARAMVACGSARQQTVEL